MDDGVEARQVRGDEVAHVADPLLVAHDDRTEVAAVVPTGIETDDVMAGGLEHRDEDLADVATVPGDEHTHLGTPASLSPRHAASRRRPA